ncbi:hypothetical protein O181_063603 [Austropuccinia psidii MF-1]|uniref:Uncharacterized protein n=1 Tax=Austropuccinia psidii MF-1 TaxID=1389203 RepID=A0A9Q3ERY8_9BASI|nr:hypothetical protein [Austropuccinia psidii MF-1]
MKKWANDACRFKVETGFESDKLNAEKKKSLPPFFQKTDRLTALNFDMSELIIHRKTLRQCGGDIEHSVKNSNNNKDRYFTIGENKHQIFAFLPFKRQITVKKASPVRLELEKLKSEQLNEAEISLHLTDKQESGLSALLYDHKEAFESDKETLRAIIGHEVDIILNIENPHPPLLRIPEYPASSQSREALEIHIKDLLDLGVIRKVGHNEEVEITTPVIVACRKGKSRMVGDFGALNT